MQFDELWGSLQSGAPRSKVAMIFLYMSVAKQTDVYLVHKCPALE